jgi:hypothetical protein
MTSDILIEGQLNDETGVLTLQFDRQIKINVSSRQAQQQVNHFVHMEISTQLHATTPILVVNRESEESLWRVPIHLTFPNFGDVGQVGFIHINPETGDMDTSPAIIKNLSDEADALASRFASPAAHTI